MSKKTKIIVAIVAAVVVIGALTAAETALSIMAVELLGDA